MPSASGGHCPTGAPVLYWRAVSKTAFDSIESVLKDVRAGKMVIVTDDAERENEGDLVMAASKVTPEAVNFMAKTAVVSFASRLP